ncbi:MAG: DUF1194 domain-containing protein, partial [Hyphomicrobiaceae bacterium]
FRLPVLAALCLLTTPAPLTALDLTPAADVALVVSVDVSQSVDEDRYRLQIDGIAKALVDPAVIDAITSGPNGRILFAMVVWADHAQLAVPWTPISTASDAAALASTVRRLKRYGGEFTCLARMFSSLPDLVLSDMPMKAARTVVDVSGDGIDNCSPDVTTRERRDELVERGVTINGLPIIERPGGIVGAGAYRAPDGNLENLRPLESREQLTLDGWYRTNVMGGDLAFILPANGYTDFARAMRQKFVTEISANVPARTAPERPAVIAIK